MEKGNGGEAYPGKELAPLLDSTLLGAAATGLEVDALCREAERLGLACVFVQPYWVERAVALLSDAPVAVGTVAGFPLGGSLAEVKVREAERALELGAREIDFVINLGALRTGHHQVVAQELRLMVEVVRGRGLSKAIIECPVLSGEETLTACRLAEEAGVDFIKTSSGFGPRGVSVEDVRYLRQNLGAGTRVKASGGIRELAQARALVAAGAARLGTSAAGRIVRGGRAS